MKRLHAIIALSVLVAPLAFAQMPDNIYGRSAQGTKGVVSAAKPEASQIGLDILKKGGNAVDAAVATAFALGVLEPNSSGIGGGGFMIIKMANMKEAVVIDFRETAPAAAHDKMFLDAEGKVIPKASSQGGLSIGVPGEVKGLLYAFDRYGSKKIKRMQLVAPAIKCAETGIPVTANLGGLITSNIDKLALYETGAAIYLEDGLPYEVGSSFTNKDLAKTLALIGKEGESAFYTGPVAEAIVAEVKKRGGIMTMEDLANYSIKVREPVKGSYRGYSILSVPPASSGGTHLIQLLNIMENFDLRKTGEGNAVTAHLWAEAMKMVFADRAQYMADTDFVAVPLAGLTSKDYAKTLAARIDPAKPMADVTAGDPSKYESGSTTSFSIMDKAGNMVAVTKSINYSFGSGVVIPGTGIIMNDHMDDFVLKPGSVNSVQAGKRPLSSMSPTLVLDPQGRAFMSVGSPGATRIFTTVAQIISNVVDFNMPIQEAVFAPRLFQMQTGSLNMEGRVSINAYEALKKLGHTVTVRNDWDVYFGGVHAVLYDQDAKVLYGAADPRRDGIVAAY